MDREHGRLLARTSLASLSINRTWGNRNKTGCEREGVVFLSLRTKSEERSKGDGRWSHRPCFLPPLLVQTPPYTEEGRGGSPRTPLVPAIAPLRAAFPSLEASTPPLARTSSACVRPLGRCVRVWAVGNAAVSMGGGVCESVFGISLNKYAGVELLNRMAAVLNFFNNLIFFHSSCISLQSHQQFRWVPSRPHQHLLIYW